jgi:hypothetical protein
MAYYIRVLSTSRDCIPVQSLRKTLKRAKLEASVTDVTGPPHKWEQFTLNHGDSGVAVVERNPISRGSLGQEELEEFRSEILRSKPSSASGWLTDYFGKVRCIYAFQLLNGTDEPGGREILDTVFNAIRSVAPSIVQADFEGFSNEDGYHILWQFNDSAKGKWWMAILKNGDWVTFQMELGNKKHRAAFKMGRVPEGVKPSRME